MNSTSDINAITKEVIHHAMTVHNALGPGLLESAYQACLHHELTSHGIYVEREKALPLIYGDVKLECGYRLDLLVERQVVVEIKSIDAIADIHLAQMLTYLKVGGFKVGLLLNFNVALMRQGIKRVINGY